MVHALQHHRGLVLGHCGGGGGAAWWGGGGLGVVAAERAGQYCRPRPRACGRSVRPARAPALARPGHGWGPNAPVLGSPFEAGRGGGTGALSSCVCPGFCRSAHGMQASLRERRGGIGGGQYSMAAAHVLRAHVSLPCRLKITTPAARWHGGTSPSRGRPRDARP